MKATEERIKDDELAYQREHRPLEHVQTLKDLKRHDEARECYLNASQNYFAYVQGYLAPALEALRGSGRLHQGK